MNGTRLDGTSIPTTWRPAVRVDRGTRLANAERTPSGGIRIDATLARSGIYIYQRADGGVTREYLPPEEASRLESLRSLRDAPVTVDHPDRGSRLVSPETYRRDNVGHVSGEPRSDGKTVGAVLAVQDAETIRRIDSGELVEVSPGYRLMLDPTPGTTPAGERYDAVQRQRVYNHVALGPKGWARGGSEASLRVDGVEDVAIEVEAQQTTNVQPPPVVAPAHERTDSMKTQRVDGFDYEVGSPAWQQACERRDSRLAAELAALTTRAKDAETAVTTQTARADAAEARVKELELELSPARIDARVSERTALLERVRPVLGADVKLDGKTPHEVRALVLAKLQPALKLDSIAEAQRETYVLARFESEMEHATKQLVKPSPLMQARGDAFGVPPAGGTLPVQPAPAPGGVDLSAYLVRPGDC